MPFSITMWHCMDKVPNLFWVWIWPEPVRIFSVCALVSASNLNAFELKCSATLPKKFQPSVRKQLIWCPNPWHNLRFLDKQNHTPTNQSSTSINLSRGGHSHVRGVWVCATLTPLSGSSAVPDTHLFTPSVGSYALHFPFFKKIGIFRPISLQFWQNLSSKHTHTQKSFPRP